MEEYIPNRNHNSDDQIRQNVQIFADINKWQVGETHQNFLRKSQNLCTYIEKYYELTHREKTAIEFTLFIQILSSKLFNNITSVKDVNFDSIPKIYRQLRQYEQPFYQENDPQNFNQRQSDQEFYPPNNYRQQEDFILIDYIEKAILKAITNYHNIDFNKFKINVITAMNLNKVNQLNSSTQKMKNYINEIINKNRTYSLRE